MTVQTTVNYPPTNVAPKFVVRARDRNGRILHFPSIKAQEDFEAAKKAALRVAKRPDAFDVRVLRIPAAR